jgi:hypothetical protein
MCIFRNVEARSHNHCCHGKAITHVLYSITFRKIVYEVMWINVVELDGAQLTIRRMPDNYGYKHTFRKCNTHCFSTQQRLRERVSVLRSTYFSCVVLKDENCNDYAETSSRPGD